MTDFFISYTQKDVKWAEWVGFALEEKGFNVIIQAWDFRPGGNFVLKMQDAATKAKRTILILSPHYLKSAFAASEWAAAFAHDPQGMKQKLVPVMVAECEPTGLLKAIVQIRLVGLDEAGARDALLRGVSKQRAKPSSPPPFPGTTKIKPPRTFPGGTAKRPTPKPRATPVIPSLKRSPTDVEKRRFITSGFETIKRTFRANLQQAKKDDKRVETDFQLLSKLNFRAELFVEGKSKCICRIWQGGMHSEDGIFFSEVRTHSENSYNEMISLARGSELAFMASMAMSSFQYEKSFDVKNLTAKKAADYLWQRFVAPLSYR